MVRRILLVDDESAVLFAYKKVLQRHELVVDASSTKEETLELLKKYRYDVAILDLRLGGENSEEGFELISHIKSKSPDTSIIMITAFGNQEIREQAFSLGADSYFEKPVSTNIIREALRNAGIQILENDSTNGRLKITASNLPAD